MHFIKKCWNRTWSIHPPRKIKWISSHEFQHFASNGVSWILSLIWRKYVLNKKGHKLGDSFFRSKSEIVTTDFVHDATTTHVGRTSDECWLLQQSTGRCFHHIRREMSATRTCRTVPSSKSAYTHVNVRNIQMGVHKNRDLKGGNAKREGNFFNSTWPSSRYLKGRFDDLVRQILINCLSTKKVRAKVVGKGCWGVD